MLCEDCDYLSGFLKFNLELKPEQHNAILSLLKRHDVFAVLPTGYGKSLIFQLFAFAASLEMEEKQTVLKSIIEDQITEAQSMGILAASAADVSNDELQTACIKLQSDWCGIHTNMNEPLTDSLAHTIHLL